MFNPLHGGLRTHSFTSQPLRQVPCPTPPAHPNPAPMGHPHANDAIKVDPNVGTFLVGAIVGGIKGASAGPMGIAAGAAIGGTTAVLGVGPLMKGALGTPN